MATWMQQCLRALAFAATGALRSLRLPPCFPVTCCLALPSASNDKPILSGPFPHNVSIKPSIHQICPSPSIGNPINPPLHNNRTSSCCVPPTNQLDRRETPHDKHETLPPLHAFLHQSAISESIDTSPRRADDRQLTIAVSYAEIASKGPKQTPEEVRCVTPSPLTSHQF